MSTLAPGCLHNCAPFSVVLTPSLSTQILFRSLLFHLASDLATQLPELLSLFIYLFFTAADYAIKRIYCLTGFWLK